MQAQGYSRCQPSPLSSSKSEQLTHIHQNLVGLQNPNKLRELPIDRTSEYPVGVPRHLSRCFPSLIFLIFLFLHFCRRISVFGIRAIEGTGKTVAVYGNMKGMRGRREAMSIFKEDFHTFLV